MSARGTTGEPPGGDAPPDDPGARVRGVLRGGGPVVVLMVLASLAAAGPLRDVEVVLHRGLDGEPTRTGAATELLVLMPVLGMLTFGMMLGAAYAGWRPSDGRPAPSPRVMTWMSAAVLGSVAGIQLVSLGDALGMIEHPAAWALLFMGGGFVLAGVLLLAPRTGEGALVMINLPLGAEPADRRRVGRVCGRGMLALGLATVVATLAGPTWAGMTVLITGSVLLVPVVLVSAARSRRPQAD